ncbi:hypothetical protein ANO14919_135550 [Xylariales sp. No.14919]|nr:hypothetical protein ANO14919_135550 [Xylariales sp. No.14919]
MMEPNKKSKIFSTWLKKLLRLNRQSAPIQTAVEPEYDASLWDAAYDILKEQHADLISRYETIVSVSLMREEEGLNCYINRIDQTNTAARRAQMAKTLDIWLQWVGNEEPDARRWGRRERTGQALGVIMRLLIREPLYTSLAWLATCFGIQATIRCDPPPGTVLPLTIYIASRMQWYLSLSKLISNDEALMEDMSGSTTPDASTDASEDTSGSTTSDTWTTESEENLRKACQRAKALRIGIINLYKAILHVEIHAACSSSEYVPLPPKTENPEDAQNDLHQNCPTEHDISALEQALVQPSGNEMEVRLQKLLLKVAEPQEDDTSSEDELIEKLHIPHQSLTSHWRFLGDCSRWETPHNVDFAIRCSYRVLWITGDATGKTGFLQSIVQRLSDPGFKSPSEPRATVAYLFRDSELKSRQGNPALILRSLIWQILRSQSSLSKHLKHKLSSTKRDDFDDSSDFYALSTLLYTLLQDDELNTTYLVLDGLEELCREASDTVQDPHRNKWGLTDMLRLICTSSQFSDRVKWLVSTNEDTIIAAQRQFKNESRQDVKMTPIANVSPALAGDGSALAVSDDTPQIGLPDHEMQETDAKYTEADHNAGDSGSMQAHTVSLSTHDSIRHAVDQYTSLKVKELASRAYYGGNLQAVITQKLQACSGGSVPWVDLACDIIESKGVPWNAPDMIENLSPDVDGLYDQMKMMLQDLSKEDEKLCNDILLTAFIAFRPLSLLEISNLVNLRAEVDLKVVIGRMCFAFLEVIEGKVCFKNSEAREYQRKQMEKTHSLSQTHAEMARQCLRATLGDIHRPDDDKPRLASYATIYWTRHLLAIDIFQFPDLIESVSNLLKSHLMHWLQALTPQNLLAQAQKHLEILESTWAEKTEQDLRSVRESGGTDSPGNPAVTTLLQNVRKAIWFLDYHHALHTPEGVSPYNTLLFCPDANELKDPLHLREILGLTTLPIVGLPSRELAPSSDVLRGHSDAVQDCAYSPDGRLIASVSLDKSLRLWDSSTGKLQHVLDAPNLEHRISQIVFSPECRGMLAATDSRGIQVWCVSTGAPAKPSVSTLNIGSIKHIAFSSNGDYLIAVTPGRVIRWHLPSYQESEWIDLGAESSLLSRARFSSDESLLAWSTTKHEIFVWNIEKAKVCHQLTGHCHYVRDISFSPDSGLLASCSEDSTVRIWDTKTGEMLNKLSLSGKKEEGLSVSFSPDGLRLACGSGGRDGGHMYLWKAVPSALGVKSYEEERVFLGHTQTVTAIRFSRDGRHILSSSWDDTLRIWQVDRLKVGVTAKDTTESSQEQSATGSQEPPQTVLECHSDTVSLVALSPNGTTVASASYSGDKIMLWDVDKGTPLRTLAGGHTGDICSLAFSQDGNTLLSASRDRTIGIWNLRAGKMVCRLTGHTDSVEDAIFSPNGHYVASASYDSTVRVWDVTDSLKGEATAVEGEHGTEPIIQTNCTSLSKHRDYAHCVAFSPDGRYLASGGGDSHIPVWDLQVLGYRGGNQEADSQLGEQQQHNKTSDDVMEQAYCEISRPRNARLSSVYDLAFAPPDGETLVSVIESWDGSNICIWKATKPRKREPRDWQFVLSFNGRKTWPNRPFRTARFDPEHPNVLLSENGPLLVETSSWVVASSMTAPPGTLYGVLEDSQDQTWITRNGEKLIFIPSRYEVNEEAFRVEGNRVIVGCGTGEVLIFGFEDRA